MKAVRLLEYGGQLVSDDVPAPAIAGDEILVKIKSTAVNHLDLVKASGAACRFRCQRNGRRVRGVSGRQAGDHRKETIRPLF
jgi:NADPH:quinone reductase-like Zn-dependent oxidoreductase